MVDSGQADLSANFTLNQLTDDLSANVTIRNVKKTTGYNPHASTDLSANFTIGQDYADLSANFTINHQSADLSANFTVHNILAYFQHAVESTTGSNFLTPQTLENYVIRQANRDKIATIDVKYSNSGDRFSWVTPASQLQIFAGTNVNNKTKIFGGHVKEPERVGEEIIFHGQGYGEELLRRKITNAFYDIEACDLIKFQLLDPTSIDTSQFGFVGEETTRTAFHSDTYADEENIEENSNVSLSGGTWDLDEETDPSDGDSYTENNSGEWGADSGFTVDDSTIKQVDSYSIRARHYEVEFEDDFEDGSDGNAVGSPWSTNHNTDCNAYYEADPCPEGSLCCRLYDNNGAGAARIYKTLASASTDDGVAEFYWRKDGSAVLHFTLYDDGSNETVRMRFNTAEKIQAYYSAAWNDVVQLADDTDYLIRVEYDLTNDTYDIYVDDSLEGDDIAFDNTAANVQQIHFQTGISTTGTGYVDSVLWYIPGGAGNREIWYPSGKDESINCNQKTQIDFYIRQDDAGDDPVLRLYSSAGNYYYRTISISSADTFENKTYDVGAGAAGWSSTGSPDWTDIDWIAFYWSSAQTTVSHTYLDGLHFDQYHASGYIISDDLTSVSEASTTTQEYFDDVKIDITSTTPTGTSITIKACNDDGTTYETFTDATWDTFTDHHSSASSHGRIFKYKIEFATTDASETPTLSQIAIDVKTKLITVYDRIEYDNETLFDAIKDVLYDATLEGYVDPDGIYQLAYVNSKTTTDFMPYLRQGYEILKQPVWKKNARLLINSIKGRGADEGSISKAEEDRWTEQSASDWDETTNITLSDETTNAYVAEGDYSIKLYREFTFDNLLTDGFEDGDITDWNAVGTAPWTAQPISGRGDFPDSDYLLRCIPTQACCDDTWQYLTKGTDSWDDYSIECIAKMPAQATPEYENKLGLVLRTSSSATNGYLLELDPKNDTMTIYKKTGATLTPLQSESVTSAKKVWYKLKFEANGTTLKGYLNEVEKVSTTDATYSTGRIGVACYFDGPGNFIYYYDDVSVDEIPSISASKATSPTVSPINLNDRLNLYGMFYPNSTDSFDIRLETSASDYYSRSVSIKVTDEFVELKLPVGSKSAGWSSTGSPDWRSIIQISFNFSATCTIYTLYLDKLYFTVSPIETSYEDTDSQTSHGVYEGKRYVNKQITSIEELEDRLKTIVESRKNLSEPLDLVVYGRRDIKTGDLVKVNYPKSGISDVVFRVDEVHYLLGTMTLTRLFCRDIDTVSASTRLKKLDYETKQQK